MSFEDLLLNGITATEVVCALVSTYYFQKLKSQNMHYIVFYLWAVMVVELFGYWMRLSDMNNVWMYNILGTLEFVTFMPILACHIKNGQHKRLVQGLLWIGLICITANLFIVKGPAFKSYWTFGFGIASLCLIVACCLYLLQLVKDDNITALRPITLFWIALGLLVYHGVSIPVTIIINKLQFDTQITDVIINSPLLFAIGMYVSFILGIIWGRKNYN